MFRSLVRRAAASGLCAFVLAACSESPTQQNTAVPGRSFSLATRPVLHPNSEKYQEQTMPHATGRAGSATLTMRALMGKDGATMVELTTGRFGEAAPGNFGPVQLKSYKADGKQFVANYGGSSGGLWSGVLNGAVHWYAVRAQANVRGIDKARTDVVTIVESVRLRPDLAITVTAPATVTPRVPILIYATVRELNGEVGATTDCILLVNGEPVDNATHVWIADGSGAECVFRYAFPTAGTYTVEARATNVDPGDWDNANNSAATQVVARNLPFTGSLTFHDYLFRDSVHNDVNIHEEGDDGWSWIEYRDQNDFREYGQREIILNAQTPERWMGAIDVSVTISSDIDEEVVWAVHSDSPNGIFFVAENSVIDLQTYWDHGSLNMYSMPRRTVYWGRNITQVGECWFDNCGWYEEANSPWSEWSDDHAQYRRWGNVVSVKIELTDQDRTHFIANPSFDLPAWNVMTNEYQPYTCAPGPIVNCRGWYHYGAQRHGTFMF